MYENDSLSIPCHSTYACVEWLGMAPETTEGLARSELLQGTLDVLILKVVALGPTHGYAIARRLQQMSGAVLQVPRGSLYPALHRLEKRRWLHAEWGPSDTGREARF